MSAIIYEKRDGIGYVTLNRPEDLNAMNDAMLAEIDDLLPQLEMDLEAKVIVFKGAGKDFCVGQDLSGVNTHEVLSEPGAFAGKHIRVRGSVSSVCASKGCWIRIGCASVDETLYVKFPCPTRGRIVPMDAVGQSVQAEGVLEISEISEADARYLAKDEGLSTKDIAKIVGPQKMIAMNSPGVIIDLKGPKGCQE